MVTLKSELNEHRMDFFEQSDDIYNLSVGGATSAAWALDERLAHEVAAGIFRKTGVLSVEILVELRFGDQHQLVYLEKPTITTDAFTSWVARKYFNTGTHRDRRPGENPLPRGKDGDDVWSQ